MAETASIIGKVSNAPTEGPAGEGIGRVPSSFLDLKAQYSSIKGDIAAAIARVMESQHFILGEEVAAFEKEVAGFVGAPFAVACASGSDALYLALLASGIGAGDEVITAPFTFVATAGAIARTGAKPVFVDIDPSTFNIDTNAIVRALTSKTRAIMPVHLFGLPADLDAILEIASRKNLVVVEDAAQAIGSRYNGKPVGSLGTYGCFSFFPSKNLGGAGDGGLITTSNAELADRLRLLRAHGSRKKYQYEIIGTNSRLDALQAAILRAKLKHLPTWTEARRINAQRYVRLFNRFGLSKRVTWPEEPPRRYHVYNQFVIRSKRRDALRQHLTDAGIPTDVYYPAPLHTQPAFAYLGYKNGDFPNSESASREVLALPVYPELGAEAQETIAGEIANFFKRSANS
jgi:dTDP-4-amino-4,6-dideoxygalactose transaminase